MGRTPCCSKLGLNRGAWTAKEDALLTNYIQQHGEGRWRHLPKNAGILRCGRSCRLRWVNYLRPDIKRGNIAPDEEDLIIRLHTLLGNRWSLIARRLPGRTDNKIKNHWNTHLSKRFKETICSDNPKSLKDKIKTKKDKKNANDEPEKTKIYFPKAIRVSPLLLTFKKNNFPNVIKSASSNGSHFKDAADYNESCQMMPYLKDCLEEINDYDEKGQTIQNLEEKQSNLDDTPDLLLYNFSEFFEENEELLKLEDQIKFDPFDSFFM